LKREARGKRTSFYCRAPPAVDQILIVIVMIVNEKTEQK